MTVFEGWLKACKETNLQVILLEKGENKTGNHLCLYKLIRQIPSIPIQVCGNRFETHSLYERFYILWFNYEKFQYFVDYCQALTSYLDHCN